MVELFKLHKEHGGKAWQASARTPEEAVGLFAHMLGVPLYICEGLGSYGLSWDHKPAPGGRVEVGVMEGTPNYSAIISQTAEGFTLTVTKLKPAAVLLAASIATEEAAIAQLESILRHHGIAPQQCAVRRNYRTEKPSSLAG